MRSARQQGVGPLAQLRGDRRCQTPPVSSATRHFINLSNGAEALPLLAGLPAEHVSFCRIQSSHCEAQDFNGVLSNLDHNLLMHLALGFECRVYDFGSRGNYWTVTEEDKVGDGKGDGTSSGRSSSSGSISGSGSGEEVAGGGEEKERRRAEGSASSDVLKGEKQYVPRAIWWGLEWSRYALNTLWHLETGPALLRGYNVEALFRSRMNMIPKPLAKRLKYYRSYTAPELREVRLRGYYAQTVLDGNKMAYRALLLAHAARSAAQGTANGETMGETDPSNFAAPMRAYDPQTARRVGIE